MNVIYEYDGHQHQHMPPTVRESLAMSWVQQWARKRHPREQVSVTLNKRNGQTHGALTVPHNPR